MTKVHCDLTMCEYCKKDGVTDFICGCDEIELVDEQCITFGAHVDMCPEYRETFLKRLSSKADKHECWRECNNGKRYEIDGLVFFTDQDDRWGIDDIWFTEKTTGLKISGKYLYQHIEDIKERITQVTPVETLPEAKEEDLYLSYGDY